MYKLFLDDERDPCKITWVQLPFGPWIVVRSYDEFVKTIAEKGLPDFVAFDHDLADEHYHRSMYKSDYKTLTEKTGYECARWLVNYCVDNNKNFPHYVVHSINPIGKENIIGYIENYKKFKNEK